MPSLSDIVCRLKQAPLFHGLEEAALQQLASTCRMRRFPPRESLFHEGDPGHTLYIVLSGRVRIQTVTASGDILTLSVCGPGEHFGILALLMDRPRTADAVTMEPCELLMLDRPAFMECLERNACVALRVIGYLTERLMDADAQRKRRRELDVLGRVAAALLEWASDTGEADSAEGRRLTVRLTQQQIAEQVGATRFSVNRALARLKELGTIRQEGRTLLILNARRLREYSSV